MNSAQRMEVILGRVVIDIENEISDKQKFNKVLAENGFTH